MCTKSGVHAPLAIKFAKITAIVIFFYFAECAAGSCISYGHACWGGHGKRSNSAGRPFPIKDLGLNLNQLTSQRWVLSRLIPSPVVSRLWRINEINALRNSPEKQENYGDGDIDNDDLKSFDDSVPQNNQEVFSQEDLLYPEVANHIKSRADKLKLYDILGGKEASEAKLK